LAGRAVELVFDPFDLTVIEVRLHDKPMGLAVPHATTRRSCPKAKPEQPETHPPRTGIDYLRLLADQHEAALRRRINHDALTDPDSATPPPRPAGQPAPAEQDTP
jgi:putative transposase